MADDDDADDGGDGDGDGDCDGDDDTTMYREQAIRCEENFCILITQEYDICNRKNR